MKKVKMLKTDGSRRKGFTYLVTSRHAEQLIKNDLAAEAGVKENKEAKGRETK